MPFSGDEGAPLPPPRTRDQEIQGLAVTGELAVAVAHDFNNIVSATQIHLGLLIRDPSLRADQKEALITLENEMARAAALTRQLLAFSRPQFALRWEVISLNQLITAVLKLLSHLMRENVTVTFQPSPDDCRIRVDVSQVEKLIMSACLFLRDAMPKGGTLTLTTRCTFPDAALVPVGRKLNAKYVCLSLKVEARTAAQPGQSASLPGGEAQNEYDWKLETANEIARLCDGWIVLNRGTALPEIQVFFAITSQPEEDEENSGDLIGGTETILLVEDETVLRRVSALSLRKLGYAVLDAADGESARKLWGKHHATIDLLLSDLFLPDSYSGYDLAQMFHAQKPALRLMLSSGDYGDLLQFAGMEGQRIFPIVKPYTGRSLAQKVRECLDAST